VILRLVDAKRYGDRDKGLNVLALLAVIPIVPESQWFRSGLACSQEDEKSFSKRALHVVYGLYIEDPRRELVPRPTVNRMSMRKCAETKVKVRRVQRGSRPEREGRVLGPTRRACTGNPDRTKHSARSPGKGRG